MLYEQAHRKRRRVTHRTSNVGQRLKEAALSEASMTATFHLACTRFTIRWAYQSTIGETLWETTFSYNLIKQKRGIYLTKFFCSFCTWGIALVTIVTGK